VPEAQPGRTFRMSEISKMQDDSADLTSTATGEGHPTVCVLMSTCVRQGVQTGASHGSLSERTAGRSSSYQARRTIYSPPVGTYWATPPKLPSGIKTR
jgi:hypothetical protein